MTNGMFRGTVGAWGVTWGTAGEGRGVVADGAGDWDGPNKMAGGAVGEGTGLMAMGVPISGVDDEEAGGDCETVSHPSEVDVSGRVRVLSASDIWMKETNGLSCNSYPCANIQKERWPKTTTKTHLQWQCDIGLGNNINPASANCCPQLIQCICLNFTQNPGLISSCKMKSNDI